MNNLGHALVKIGYLLFAAWLLYLAIYVCSGWASGALIVWAFIISGFL